MIVTQSPTARRARTRRCLDQLASGDHAHAVVSCEAAFDLEGAASAGAAAAEARLVLGQHGQVHAWVQRLRGSPEEARALELSAAAFRRQGSRPEAQRAYMAACRLNREVGDAAALCRNLFRLFHLAWEASDYRAALGHASAALAAARESRQQQMVGMVAEGLFALLYDVGDLDGARQALDVADELLGSATGSTLNNRGLIHLAAGHTGPAESCLERARAIAEREQDRDLERYVHLNLVDVALRKGCLACARSHLALAEARADPHGRNRAALLCYEARLARSQGRMDEAAAILTEALAGQPAPEWAWELEHERGLVSEARGDAQAAEEAFARACDILDQMRLGAGYAGFKSWHTEKKRASFEALFTHQISRAGGVPDAVNTSERVRLRSQVDDLLGGAVSDGGHSPGSLPEILAKAGDHIDKLQMLVPTLGSSRALAPEALPGLLKRIGPHHVYVYFAARDAVWLCRLRARSVTTRRLRLPRQAIEALARRVVADPDAADAASQLGEALLPGDMLPVPGQTLHVVLDGPLNAIPFSALRIGGRYLIERHAVVRLPHLGPAPGPGKGGPPQERMPLVLGDPLGDLPGARREAEGVAHILGCPAVLGSGAVARHLLGPGPPPWIMHLATHGGLSPRGYWLQAADRRVTADEIIRHGHAPRVVVLASCGSASRSALSIAGPMANAYLAAGSRAVVGTLWSVADEDASRVFLRFYAERGAEDPVGALARCQRRAIAAGLRPAFWGAFVVHGSLPLPGEDS